MEAALGLMSVFSLSTHITLSGEGLPFPHDPLLVHQPGAQRQHICLTSLATLTEEDSCDDWGTSAREKGLEW